jgi:hypothetical protein
MVNKKSVGKRLDALEERTFGADPFRDFPDWDLSDQLDCAAYTLQFYMRFHGDGRVRYPATDREAHMLGLLCAFLELPDGLGEHAFPSGVSVAWRDDDKGGGHRYRQPDKAVHNPGVHLGACLFERFGVGPTCLN